MIELLVVIGVIAILVGLIVAAAGHAMSAARQHHVEAQRESLTSAIEAYKRKVGYYPPDNPNNPAQSPLFYELTGTVTTPDANGSPARYTSQISGDTFVVANGDFATVFGPTNVPGSVVGFVNASADPSQVRNFFAAAAKSGITGKLVTAGVTNTFFGVPLSGPLATNTVDGKNLAPWSYVSTNPTNNSGSYDLWVDVTYGGKTNRFSNWSKEPQVQ